MSLSELPTEVLRIVATDCSVKDILALGKTSGFIRNSCYHSVVFESITYRLLYGELPVAFDNTPSLISCIKCAVEELEQGADTPSSALVWARVAFLAEQLPNLRADIRALSDDRGNATREKRARIISILSTAIVWGYGPIYGFDVAEDLYLLCRSSLIEGLGPETEAHRSPQNPRALECAFSLAVSSIQVPYWHGLPPSIHFLDNGDLYDEEDWRPFDMDEDSDLIGRTVGARFWDDEEGPANARGTHIFLIIASAVNEALRRLDIMNHEVTVRVPDPDRLDMLRRLGGPGASSRKTTLPLPDGGPTAPEPWRRANNPFSSPSWHIWYREHVQALVRGMCDGEWCGYYTLGVRVSRAIETPIGRVRFEKLREDPAVMTVRASGLEGRDNITIEGWIRLQDGRVFLELRQPGRRGWDWRGQMTPLGISGLRYRPGTTVGPWGMFWIWRQDWVGRLVLRT